MVSGVEDLRKFISSRVRDGFESPHEIVEGSQHWVRENECEDLLPEIKRLTAEALSAHQEEQAGWGPTTDCDRLNAAFAALNAQGIVARQDFSCCNNCGFAEIWDEVEEEEKQHIVEGYVFYHLQCTEQAVKTGQLLMAYGSVEEDSEALVRVANTIVSELRKAGLNASWGGTVVHPIVVEGLVWRRRRNSNRG
jgi:hypothetical protein